MKKKWNWKSFGDEETHLRRSDLSEKALSAYSQYEPLDIYEEKQEDGTYLYYLRGCIEGDELTVAKLNDLFERLFDDDAYTAIKNTVNEMGGEEE